MWIYGIFIGAMIVFFRYKAVFAGGVAFAILLGNMIAPSLDLWIKRYRGRKPKAAAVNKKSPVYILFFMAAICIVFGIGVSVVNYATQGLLARNAAMHRNRVLCRAFCSTSTAPPPRPTSRPWTSNLEAFEIGEGSTRRQVYRQTTPDCESLGFVVGGMGFWDRIEGIVVLTPDLKQILNIQFLDQKETPGLGARIEEPWFTEQFQDLQVDWNDPQGRRIVVGASPDPNARNRVDAITGATQTSMALMRFLNEELDLVRSLYPAPSSSVSPEPRTLNPEP